MKAKRKGTTKGEREKSNRYELIACAFGGHVLVGTDVRVIDVDDGMVVRQHGDLRWHRCLRCDCWVPKQPPREPSRDRLPGRDEIKVPLRGRGLRDRYILRLIAFERAIHVLVLSGLAVAVFVFIGHRQTVKHDYIVIINGLFGSSSSSKSPKGILGDFRHLFVISPSHLYDIGFLLVAYATLEAFEMVGLWFAKRWAEYLTFLATLLFVPLEVYELYTGFSSLKVVIFILNMAIVIYLLLGKRLFGLRGGHAADVARRRADGGWEAIDRRPPGQPLRRVQNVTPVATSLVVPGAGTTDGTTADSTMADSTTADGTTADGTTADGTTADGTADGDVDRSGV